MAAARAVGRGREARGDRGGKRAGRALRVCLGGEHEVATVHAAVLAEVGRVAGRVQQPHDAFRALRSDIEAC